jgi:type IX secretion system PorP/SprF family membrane protein
VLSKIESVIKIVKMKRSIGLMMCFMFYCLLADGQSMHFSQYYNAPMLLNPANTALMPEDDYRVGLNYRNQWAVVPVPYNTFSAFGDVKLGGNKDNENHNNWLGLGLAFFNDKAGDGNLSLAQFQASLAYHLQLSHTFMLSLGVSGSYVQRSVNYDNLTFDAQWDGMTFNSNMSNAEKLGIIKTTYYKVAPGINFAWFPNENLYVKVGGSLDNLNRPTETFYKNGKNTLDYRPIGNIDVVIKTGPVLIVNPSAYYTQQSGAAEMVVGAQFRTILTNTHQLNPMITQLILGVYDRLNDAVIGMAGVQVGGIQFVASYDFTMSALAPYNASYGALEFSLVYTGKYGKNKGVKSTYSCPRFF